MTINPNDSQTLMFNDVLNIISAITVDGKLLFKYVAPFNNQIEKFGTPNNFDINNMPINRNLPFDMPACFVEIVPDAINDLSGTYQEINGRLIIYISVHEYDLDEVDRVLAHNIRFTVHQALHHLGSYDNRYVIRRATESTDRNFSNLYTYQLVYQFNCTDNTYSSEYAIFGTNGLGFNIDIQI